MAQITAAMVKQLREMTDSPMMECKKALVEADGDMDAAVDVLRKNGLAKAAKKAGRETNEGAVAAFVSEDGKTALCSGAPLRDRLRLALTPSSPALLPRSLRLSLPPSLLTSTLCSRSRWARRPFPPSSPR